MAKRRTRRPKVARQRRTAPRKRARSRRAAAPPAIDFRPVRYEILHFIAIVDRVHQPPARVLDIRQHMTRWLIDIDEIAGGAADVLLLHAYRDFDRISPGGEEDSESDDFGRESGGAIPGADGSGGHGSGGGGLD
jgi:hypothetical protein